MPWSNWATAARAPGFWKLGGAIKFCRWGGAPGFCRVGGDTGFCRLGRVTAEAEADASCGTDIGVASMTRHTQRVKSNNTDHSSANHTSQVQVVGLKSNKNYTSCLILVASQIKIIKVDSKGLQKNVKSIWSENTKKIPKRSKTKKIWIKKYIFEKHWNKNITQTFFIAVWECFLTAHCSAILKDRKHWSCSHIQQRLNDVHSKHIVLLP